MTAEKLSPYQVRLFAFLSVATLFEGYDFFALPQILPNLREDFGLSKQAGANLFAFVNAGTIVAWLLVRRADRWGRRRVLMVTILGYTFFTLLTGLAWNAVSFAVFQFFARIFLIAEWATSMVYAAEEYPASRRGMVIGVLQAFSSLGAIVCVGVVPFLLNTEFGWRAVYFVGVLPLLLLAFARRNLKETRRFEEQVSAGTAAPAPMLRILRSPHRKRVLQLGLIWFVTYACSNTAVSFWKDHAVTDLGWTDEAVAGVLTVAALISMPLIFFAGKLIDIVGRRPGAALIFAATSAGVWLSYSLDDTLLLTLSMTLAVFGVSSVLPVLNAFTTELFPTEYRGDAFAWANNLLGRIGYVLAPIGIGWAAERWDWGTAIRPTAIFPLLALGLIFWLLPETRGLELEETAGLPEDCT